MFRWILATACTVLLAGGRADEPPAEPPAPATEPASRPTERDTTLRKPEQADILRNLLRQQDRLTPIAPQPLGPREGGSAASQPGMGAEGEHLLFEGTFLVERPGRLVREGGRAKFVFYPEAGSSGPQTMEICPSQLLETMEREAEAGFSDFIISAEVTAYRGSNYLILRKVLRRVGHGNLSP